MSSLQDVPPDVGTKRMREHEQTEAPSEIVALRNIDEEDPAPGPPRPPPGDDDEAADEDDNGPTVGPLPPAAKKRRVRWHVQAANDMHACQV